ncbi:hypothetical protein GOODEAATRI_000541, partial [Goodea atripinnis]
TLLRFLFERKYLLVFTTAYIPDELYKRVYDFCKRLLTYPHPFCTVGLSYTRQIKTERFIPGSERDLFQMHLVFVLADPDIFSGSMIPAIMEDFEVSASASAGFQSQLEHMRSVVQHTLQAALGPEQCHGSKLAQALRVSGFAT